MKKFTLYILLLALGIILATCSKEEVNSNELTINYEFTDPRDGEIYEMIGVGDNFWMTRNLEYTPSVGVSSYYDNDSTLSPIHGKLYDFTAAINAVPDGWHIPSKQEWQELIEHLGGQLTAGGQMKSVQGNYWSKPNVGATNAYGFQAHGSGFIDGTGSNGFMEKTTFWSSTTHETQPDQAYIFSLVQESAAIFYDQDYKYSRFSIRCVKD